MRVSITGIPYAQAKTRGRRAGTKEWSNAVIQQTSHLQTIECACHLDVVFRLPPSKYPADHPYGMDLDNLLKRLLDALQETVFRKAPGKDGCVVDLHASKQRVDSDSEAGADIEIRPIRSKRRIPCD